MKFYLIQNYGPKSTFHNSFNYLFNNSITTSLQQKGTENCTWRCKLSYNRYINAIWTGKTSLPHLQPLGPYEALPRPVKFYFVLICPTIITILFNRTCFIDINIFDEITIKFIPSNQTIFNKNWMILSKFLTRQYHNKRKSLNIHAFKYELIFICLFK